MSIIRVAWITTLFLAFIATASAEVRVSTAAAMSAAIKKTEPIYSPIAKQMNVSGKVDVEVTINTDGDVDEVKAVSGNALLTPGVIDAVKKWKFTPFQQNGMATTAIAVLSFEFKK